MLDTNRLPFFILGAQRSGTTMLRLMLNTHSNLAVPHETGFIVPFYQKLSNYMPLSDNSNLERIVSDIGNSKHVIKGKHIKNRQRLLSMQVESYADLVDAIMMQCAQEAGKQRWGDKTPSYTTDLDILWRLFPGCKFIHLVRDGRDVLLSQRKLSWGSKNTVRLAEDWRWKTTLCHKVGSVLPAGCFLEIRYEDLITNTEEKLRTICEFLGEPFEKSLLEYHVNAKSSVPSASLQWHENSIRPPDPDKLYAWKSKLSIADRVIFEQVAGPTLELFNYEIENLHSTLSSKTKALYYATIMRW